MTRLSLALTALAATALLACGDSPSEVEHPFRFQLNVTGDMTAALEGRALFASDSDENGQPVFAVLLMNEDEESMVLFSKAGAARPPAGTFSFAADPAAGEWAAVLTSTRGEELLGFFIAEAGSITITETTPTRVRGSVQFTASGFTGDLATPATVTVSGTFDARVASNAGIDGARSR